MVSYQSKKMDFVMKLDYDLIREILIEVENRPAGEIILGDDFLRSFFESDFNQDDQKVKDATEHIILLKERKLLEAEFTEFSDGSWELHLITRLTFDGHEYLDKIRNDKIWSKTKVKLKEIGLKGTVSLISKIADNLIEEML